MVNRGRKEYHKYPDTAFSGKGNICKEDARVAELERLVGKLYVENAFLKKSFEHIGEKNNGGEINNENEGKFMIIQPHV